MLEHIDPNYQGPLILYGLALDHSPFQATVGVQDHPLQWAQKAGFGVLVSATALPQIRAQRAHLVAYNSAIIRLMEFSSILPFSFGSIAKNQAELDQHLSLSQSAIVTKLNFLSGLIEMNVRISLTERSKFEFMAESDAFLRSWRDELVANPASITHAARIEAGRMVERAMERWNQQCLEGFHAATSGLVKATQFSQGKSPQVLGELQCLIPRGTEKDFEARIRSWVKVYDDCADMNFSISGPWAPFSFSDLKG